MEDRSHEIAIPPVHSGPVYYEVMADISRKRSTQRYLEIGVSTGLLLQHIHTDLAVGVDPVFALRENIMLNKKTVHFHQMTSDAFFADANSIASVGGPIDLAFLDGMHTFEFLLRDFFNTEQNCGAGSLIGMHDCLPLNAEMAHRNFGYALQIGKNTQHPDYWTGDVWKIIPILQKYRPDLRLVHVMTPPTGIVFITNLDKSNVTLKSRYLEIVDEFTNLPNTIESINELYRGIEIIPAAKVMNDFDYSLYFRS